MNDYLQDLLYRIRMGAEAKHDKTLINIAEALEAIAAQNDRMWTQETETYPINDDPVAQRT